MDVPRPGSEPPSSPQLLEEGGEEEDEELSGGEESDLRVSSGRGSLLTRRGITLRVLLKDGLVEPGDGVLSIHYLVNVIMSHLITLHLYTGPLWLKILMLVEAGIHYNSCEMVLLCEGYNYFR